MEIGYDTPLCGFNQKVGAGPCAARQRRLNASRGIAFGQPDHAGKRAVEIDVQGRRLKGSLDAGIGYPRHMFDLAKQFFRINPIGFQIIARDLDINWRRGAEI